MNPSERLLITFFRKSGSQLESVNPVNSQCVLTTDAVGDALILLGGLGNDLAGIRLRLVAEGMLSEGWFQEVADVIRKRDKEKIPRTRVILADDNGRPQNYILASCIERLGIVTNKQGELVRQ